jgi:uracil-DNA glycosylase
MPTRTPDADVVFEANPPLDCTRCPRLAEYRALNRAEHPAWFNAPAPSFGDPEARLLVVGLAPGRRGANRTGRPFTGDFAGELLYRTLRKYGFAHGAYGAEATDGLELHDCMITNAVRCAPPGNRPLPEEEAACRPFLKRQIEALQNLRALVVLGDVSRKNVLRALGASPTLVAAGHGVETDVGSYRIFSSYHCSRLNTNTGRLTPAMFEAVFASVSRYLDPLASPRSRVV